MAFVLPIAAEIGEAVASVGSTAASAAGSVAATGVGAAGVGAATATPYVLSAATLVGSLGQAYGAYEQGQAGKVSEKYNAAVSQQNANVAKQNEAIAGQAGEEQAAMVQQRTRATVGAIRANQAASGIDVNSGSDVDVRSSASELGELDALTVRSNATREAYGYGVQAENFEAQGTLDQFEGENDLKAGEIGAGSTFLSGLGSAANNYARYQMSGGFGF